MTASLIPLLLMTDKLVACKEAMIAMTPISVSMRSVSSITNKVMILTQIQVYTVLLQSTSSSSPHDNKQVHVL